MFVFLFSYYILHARTEPINNTLKPMKTTTHGIQNLFNKYIITKTHDIIT